MNLFDFPKYKIEKKIRLIELFAGVGSQAMALRDIHADFEHYRVCEFDKYAIASYNAIHGTKFETSDITKLKGEDLGIVDTDKYTYIMTYSFPCQDLSLAGKQKGMKKGTGTRSGLLWEVERLLNECEELPDVLLMENVPQVHSEQNKNDFDDWLSFLRSKGYHNFYKDLNAKNFGIPQNRDRCFCVSILSNDFVDYEFPNEIKLNFKMKDLLEPVVDEKYYINSPKSKELIEKLIVENKITTEETVDLCLKNPKKIEVAIRLGNIYNENAGAGFAGNVWDKNGISPTLTTMQGGGREPMIIDETKYNLVLEEKNGFYEQAIKTAEENNAQEGDIIDAFNQKVLKDGISPTITTRPEGKKTAILPVVKNNKIEKVGQISSEGSQCGTVVSDNGLYPTISAGCHGYANPHVWNNYRIRKLTPRECWRLMGFTDADYEAAEKVNSNTQLYKQAGNSIVKNVLMAIFNELINPSLMD